MVNQLNDDVEEPEAGRSEAAARARAAKVLVELGCPTEILWAWRGASWWLVRPKEPFAPFIALPDDAPAHLTPIPGGQYFEGFPIEQYRQD